MKSINDILNLKVKVKNYEGDHDSSVNWLNYYFNRVYKCPPFTSMKCPSCNKTMYLKRNMEDVNNSDIMVGAHVTWMENSKYILPICKECNDQKGNLPPFEIEFGRLCALPKE